MKQTLYTNKQPKIYVDKTKHLQSQISLQGNFKEPFDTTNPVFVIDIAGANRQRIQNSNYVFLDVIVKYYYIEQITFVTETIVELKLHCDVLMTHKNEILEQTALVKRQEYKFNMFIQDGALQTYYNPLVSQKSFPYGFNSDNYVLCVQGV